MGEREADLALVVSPPGGLLASRGGGRSDGGRTQRRERKRVVVPAEQHRLEEDCKDAEEYRPASWSRHLRLASPHLCGEAQMHVSRIPAVASSSSMIHYKTTPRSAKPFPVAAPYVRVRASLADHRPRRGVLTLAASSSPRQEERPRLGQHLAQERRDAGRLPSGSHQGCSGHTSAQPVHASSKMSYTQSTFV
jgi:hypothetical protein